MATRERIEQDLAALAEALAALNLEFRSAYEGYLSALGQAVKQQLILAGYHICTQAAPEAFLQLSFDRRQNLQQSLRLLATGTREKLRSLMSETNEEKESAEEVESPADNDRVQAENYLLSIANSPESLARWQDSVERAIANIIKMLSRDANRVLQQSGIVPRQLPEPVLEAASQAEPSGEGGVAGQPNILSLIVETDVSSVSSESENLLETPTNTAMHVTAIKLRLSEIEFADANISVWRQQIRNLSLRLNSIGRDYQKKRRELAVVEAESAWRSSWFED
ncbi:MAG: hypothetical protein MUE44_31060 [Oscillatoriaceae cyanobacterium Prado104]|nr:hypothetical protein [Oscillatoriaceae cyanobacterium Prado104]